MGMSQPRIDNVLPLLSIFRYLPAHQYGTLTNEWFASDESFHYIGNIIADAQIMVPSAIYDQDEVLKLKNNNILQTGVNTINSEIINWAADPFVIFVC